MISYAQNAEDVVLARAFDDQPGGFYVDVGAWHPELDSVTKHFYDRGWRGINVEPLPDLFALLERERPEDVNLPVALSDRPGTATLFVAPEPHTGLTTLSEERIALLVREFGEFARRDVPLRTLADVCEEHVDRTIDFLKIDVEGLEDRVLAGADFRRWPPRVLVIEVSSGGKSRPEAPAWETRVLAAGYRFALFDGVNRFYVHERSLDLLPRLALPASALDGFRTAREVRIDAARAAAEAYAKSLEQAREVAERHARDLERALGERARAQDDRIAALERQAADEAASRGDLRQALDGLAAGDAALREQLGAVEARRESELRWIRGAVSGLVDGEVTFRRRLETLEGLAPEWASDLASLRANLVREAEALRADLGREVDALRIETEEARIFVGRARTAWVFRARRLLMNVLTGALQRARLLARTAP